MAIYKTVLIIFPLNLQTITINLDVVKIYGDRLGAGDAMAATQPDASIASAFGNRFSIPLDFEILMDHGPFYQAGLNDRLSFELTFNDYGRVIMSTDRTASYEITNISLEFDVVTNPDLARRKRQQYMSQQWCSIRAYYATGSLRSTRGT